MHKWDKLWKTINEKTGIADPQVFFEKFNSRDTMETNMEEMRKNSEKKLETLKLAHQVRNGKLQAAGATLYPSLAATHHDFCFLLLSILCTTICAGGVG